jgi:hypothetical protein
MGFLDIDSLDQKFDAILFFESFHHCSDHQTLLAKLKTVLVEGGRVFFAAEPITPTFSQPWGLRLDGESLWAIRRFGWLELGFQDSYFVRTLQRGGWVAKKHLAQDTHLGQIYEARRANGLYEVSTFDMPPDEDATWAEAAADSSVGLRYSGGRTRLTVEAGGPYECIQVEGVNPSPKKVSYKLKHGHHSLRGEAAPGADFVLRLGYDPSASTLLLGSDTWIPSQVTRSSDERRLGLGIRSVRLLTAAAR